MQFSNMAFNWLIKTVFCDIYSAKTVTFEASADPEGGTGGPDPPPGKSQVIWVSIGNKQLDPPPPPPEKCWTPSGTLKNDRFH